MFTRFHVAYCVILAVSLVGVPAVFVLIANTSPIVDQLLSRYQEQ